MEIYGERHTASDDRKSGLSISMMAAFWHFMSLFSLNLGE